MNVRKEILNHFLLIPKTLTDDRRLGPQHLVAYATLDKMKENDGSVSITAQDLAFYLRCTGTTAAKVIVDLDECGWIKIKEKKEGRGGGFRLVFLNVLALAFALSLAGPLSQNENSSTLSIMGTKRRRKKDPGDAPGTDDHWFENNRRQIQHPLGQLRPV